MLNAKVVRDAQEKEDAQETRERINGVRLRTHQEILTIITAQYAPLSAAAEWLLSLPITHSTISLLKAV